MKIEKFNLYTDHIWKMREYLQQIDQFDYPWYGGLKRKFFSASPEACDAFQNIWHHFCEGKYKSKLQFRNAYKTELKRIGEDVKG